MIAFFLALINALFAVIFVLEGVMSALAIFMPSSGPSSLGGLLISLIFGFLAVMGVRHAIRAFHTGAWAALFYSSGCLLVPILIIGFVITHWGY